MCHFTTLFDLDSTPTITYMPEDRSAGTHHKYNDIVDTKKNQNAIIDLGTYYIIWYVFFFMNVYQTE